MSKAAFLRVARWVLAAPGAALAGWLVWAALQAFARVTLWAMNLDSETVAGRAYVETLSGLLAGLAFLYAGVKLAPARRRRVAYALGALGLLAAGFVLFPALARADYWTAWNVACAIVGAAAVVAAVGEDESASYRKIATRPTSPQPSPPLGGGEGGTRPAGG